MNLKFVFDIIDSHIMEYNNEYEDGTLYFDDWEAATEALKTLKSTLKEFIKEAKQFDPDKLEHE